ncbi:O-antigen ligase family protein [Sporosarcina sp. SG10008]|uniref:O-antigen ligase family protein n=1 Tax=Sporosarcina sp. SG10008 TaxID=3373103 RepID=UPI0037DC5D17
MAKIIEFLFLIGIAVSFLPIKVLGLNLTLGDFFYVICFILILIEKLKINNLTFYRMNLLHCIGLYFLVFGSIISTMNSLNPLDSLSTILQYIFSLTILYYNVKYLIFMNDGYFRKIILAIMLPLSIYASINFLSFLNIYNYFDYIIVTGSGRYSGFFGNPNGLGQFMIMNIIIIIYLLYTEKRKRIFRFVLYVSLILSFFSIMLAASFGSILTLFTTMLITIIVLQRKIKFNNKKLISFTFLFALLTAFSNRIIEIVQNSAIGDVIRNRLATNSDGIGSSSMRMDLNIEGLSHFFQNPLIGTGYSQFSQISIYNATIHNTIIGTAAEAGLFGLIGIIILLFFPAAYILKLYFSSDISIDRNTFFFFLSYSIYRIIATASTGHYINREQWIIILIIFATREHLANRNKKWGEGA